MLIGCLIIACQPQSFNTPALADLKVNALVDFCPYAIVFVAFLIPLAF